MLWLYWRRSRVAIGATGLTLGALAALALVASALAGGGPGTASPAVVRGASIPAKRSALPAASDPMVRRGLLLLAAAVAACRTVPYRGVQIVAWTSPEGSSSHLLYVWHRPGEPELAADDDDADDDNGSSQGLATGAGSTVGVLSISQGMLDLLRVNYVIEYAGSGSSSNRQAEVVEVWRHDGTLAARYWLDRATGLPLRREMYDRSGRQVSEGAFIDLQIGGQEVGDMPAEAGRAWSEYVPPTPTAARPTAARLAALRADGWPVPGRLAGNMILAGVSRTATAMGPVLDARYSDGLSIVSVFMQRGVLPRTLHGWHETEVSGARVLATESGDLDEQGLAWSAGGIVYTVIADAPPAAVVSIVAQLPHDRNVGFWSRVARGLKRMASWFDPFD